MLQTLREKTSGWIAGVIVLILAIPFAFFGMEQYLFQAGGNYAAKVSAPPSWWRSAPHVWPVTALAWQSEEIGTEEFRAQLEQSRQLARQQQGEAFDARAFESAENKRRVLDTLIDQAVARLVARTGGFAVGDAQVRAEIQAIPAFQVDGRFDPQRYQLALQGQVPSRSPREFEALVRAGLEQSLVPTEVAETAFVTPHEHQRVLRMLGEQRDVSFAVLPAPAPDAGAITAKEIQDWYSANVADYRAPEAVTIEYVEVDSASMAAPPTADEAGLRERYQRERSRFVEPDQRLASHILVRVPEGADAAAQKAAEDRAKALAAQASAAGADFAALARDGSQDEGSAEGGGDLGWIERGMMAGPFEDALFAMAAGEVRGPVKSDFGWHVIQLREVRDGAQTPFEQVRDTLAAEQAASDRERVFNERIGRLVDQVYRNPTALAPAAESEKLPVQTAGPFARGEGEGIAANAAVQRAAFSEALVQDGTVSDPIEISPGRSVLIRVTDHSPERALPLSQVRDRVVAAIRADRAGKALLARADAMVVELRGGAGLESLAQAEGLESQSFPGLQRGMPVPAAEAADAYFQAPVPAEGKPSADRVVLEDGRIVVFTVDKVTPGDADALPADQRAMLAAQLRQLSGSEESGGMLRALRRQMRIDVNEARL